MGSEVLGGEGPKHQCRFQTWLWKAVAGTCLQPRRAGTGMGWQEVSSHCSPFLRGTVNFLLSWACCEEAHESGAVNNRENTGRKHQSDLTAAHPWAHFLALGEKAWIQYRLAWGGVCV